MMPAATSDHHPFWGWSDIGLFAGLALPCIFLASALTRALFLLPGPAPGEASRAMTLQALGYALWFAGLWALLKLRYDQPFWRSMGWRVPWPRMGVTLLLGPVLVLVVVALGGMMRTPVVDNSIQQLLRDRWSVVLVGVFAVTAGPLAEELMFRGFLQPVAMRSLGAWAGVALASAPFALLHGPQYQWSWQHIALLFLASCTFGVVRWRTNSTAASTLVHASYNLTFYLGYLLQRKDLLN
jgi:membrane protease YdiL (CAAX protease family)